LAGDLQGSLGVPTVFDTVAQTVPDLKLNDGIVREDRQGNKNLVLVPDHAGNWALRRAESCR